MSILTLQFGQCGNQVGHKLFSLLSKDLNLTSTTSGDSSYYFEESTESWFRSAPQDDKYVARAVLVDTEQKVINQIQKCNENAAWKYDPTNIISHKDGGAGNNWAHGYGKKGPEMRERIEDCVRKNVENCDLLYGFLSILSSAGGTGSGVGTYILEKMQDEYPTKLFVNAVVLPYSTGEIITQNYNTVLTLSKLYDTADMSILFPNDHLHKMCVNLLKKENTDLQDLNNLIAMKISSVFQPVSDYPSAGFGDIVLHLVSHPEYKFVTVKTAPHYPKASGKFETKSEWPTLVNHMKQTLRLSDSSDWETKSLKSKLSVHPSVSYVPCVSNVLVTRGEGEPIAVPLQDSAIYPQWVPEDHRCLHYHQKRKFLNMDKFISLVSNNGAICQPVNMITEKAWKTYTYRAHIHHYSKFSVKESHFLQSFATVESIIKSYQEFTRPESLDLDL